MVLATTLQRHFLLPDGAVRAVDGIDLTIAPGEFVAVMGASGSGKSTLLYLLGGMDRPTGGELSVAGHRLDRLDDQACSRFRNETLGFVFQSFHLLPRLDLRANVELPLVYADVPPARRRQRSTALLRALGLGERLERPPTELSGGQCQRAAIARALVNRPRLLLADEPTGNLDSRTALEVMAIFQALHRQGMTVIMVTHDQGMASHATRVIRMRDGRVIGDDRQPAPSQAPLPAGIDPAVLGSGGIGDDDRPGAGGVVCGGGRCG